VRSAVTAVTVKVVTRTSMETSTACGMDRTAHMPKLRSSHVISLTVLFVIAVIAGQWSSSPTGDRDSNDLLPLRFGWFEQRAREHAAQVPAEEEQGAERES